MAIKLKADGIKEVSSILFKKDGKTYEASQVLMKKGGKAYELYSSGVYLTYDIGYDTSKTVNVDTSIDKTTDIDYQNLDDLLD